MSGRESTGEIFHSDICENMRNMNILYLYEEYDTIDMNEENNVFESCGGE